MGVRFESSSGEQEVNSGEEIKWKELVNLVEFNCSPLLRPYLLVSLQFQPNQIQDYSNPKLLHHRV